MSLRHRTRVPFVTGASQASTSVWRATWPAMFVRAMPRSSCHRIRTRPTTRALLYGAGAALAGCIGYALFGILTGITLGYAAVGVGWLIGKAMRKGSGGLGGRRYQVTAALLTYAAVAVAFVPMALHDMDRTREGKASQSHSVQQTDAQQADHAEQKASQDTGKPANAHSSFLLAILMLLGVGLISPFLIFTSSVGSGLLNLFILALGVRAAWQLSAGG